MWSQRHESLRLLGREKLVRYAARPPFCEDQLKIVEDGRVELQLRSPTKAGQTHVQFHPVQFLRRLAWLIPPPYMNMTRYCGVFAATHKLRSRVVPKRVDLSVVTGSDDTAPAPYRMAWAKLLARVYDIDADKCPTCGGKLTAVKGVTDAAEIAQYLKQGLSVLGATGPPNAA